jgi:hypothetical protein
MVTAADYLCCQSGFAAQAFPVLEVPDETWDMAHIKAAELPGLLDAFFARLPEAEELVRGLREP